ncbi:MAG TPA: hypothetical protein VJN68_02080 [Burkholderiaceae bacterium]|nr:hypothetical protein [Burkholderiaceae bacterium]
MAVLQLQFDIDSEVYPELHELLASIGNGVSREERMRQLAAIGLVWERTRLRAQADVLEAMPVSMASAVPQALAASVPTRQFPVLTDVVDPSEVSVPNQTVALHGSADDGRVGANDPVHDVPQARQQAHRSRLRRMKDKGLFRNE